MAVFEEDSKRTRRGIEDVDQTVAMSEASITPRLILILVSLGFGSASMGYASSIIATTLSQPSWYITMNLAMASNAAALIGATNGLFYAGGALGSLLSGYITHKYGRKKSAGLAAVVIILSSALIAGSVHIAMFITFRFFQGWGAFQMLSTIPMWMSELVPPKKRGALVQIHPSMINFGYMAASYTGVGFYYYNDDNYNQWRGPLGLAALFPLLLLLGFYWIPESPRFLLANDKSDEAWRILRQLRSSSKDPNDLFAKKELYQIEQQVRLDKTLPQQSIGRTYRGIFTKPSLRKRAFMTMYLTFMQMSSGALVINNYGGLIYTSLGFSATDVLQIQGGLQVCGWVSNTLAMLIIERFPRNKLLSLGCLTSGITVAVETALQKNYIGTTDRGGLIACVVMLFLNVVCFGLFLEGPGFTFVAEIWPTFTRGEGYALGMCSLCIASIIWLEAAPSAFEAIGWKFYIIFIVFAVIAAVVLWFYPDTRGKPLEEVAALFGDQDQVAVYQTDMDDDKFVHIGSSASAVTKLQINQTDDLESART